MSTEVIAHTPIRTAVLGYGLAGRVFHCPFVHAVPGLELTAIVQRTGDTAAAAYPHARIERSIDAVLEDPSIQLIVLATPNASHVEQATAALQAGKHVVVDKPLAPTSAETRTLIELAAATGRLLAPFHNRRYDGDFLTVKKLIEERTLGRIVKVVSHFDRYRPLQRPNSWKEESGPASGNLFDLGPHLIDQAIALFGTPRFITASIRFERDQTAIDDAGEVTLEFEVDGRIVRYECGESMLAAEPTPRFLVQGTHGSYIKYGVDPQEPTLLKTDRRPPMMGSAEDWFTEPEAAWGSLTRATKLTEPVEVERAPLPTERGDYRRFYANVRDAILGTAPLAIPAEDAFRTIRLLELALESSRQQRTLPVDFA
jgi:predicted dehydrogenase